MGSIEFEIIKDGTISKLAREIEGYKKELRDKEKQMNELKEKFASLESDKDNEKKLRDEQELIVLRTVSKNSN
jgi:hypothetical protein